MTKFQQQLMIAANNLASTWALQASYRIDGNKHMEDETNPLLQSAEAAFRALVERAVDFRSLEMASYRPFRIVDNFCEHCLNKTQMLCTPEYWIEQAKGDTWLNVI